jgi:hypothetical protein
VLLATHKLERRDAVPAAEVRRLVEQLVDIMVRHVPPEGHAAVGRELALLGARQTQPQTAPTAQKT